ncbi:MAG: YebC/PmpR family DNA-binding transcriptional regulator [Bacteroidales bacterium]
MSGHNKWSTIKRKKGALDSKRSKIFSRIIKEIAVAVREGGADPDGNPRLRLAVSNAKGANMPKENLLRAINKASDKDSASFSETTFECYAPHGIAIFIECTTDNEKRTISNIRSYFNKYNGSLGTNGSLLFLFDRKGIFTIPQADLNLEEVELDLIDAGAEDISLEDEYYTVTTAMEDFGAMIKKLEELKIVAESAELQRIPKNTETIDVDSAKKVMKLIDVIEEDDDVVNVFHNMEMSDELIAELEK